MNAEQVLSQFQATGGAFVDQAAPRRRQVQAAEPVLHNNGHRSRRPYDFDFTISQEKQNRQHEKREGSR